MNSKKVNIEFPSGEKLEFLYQPTNNLPLMLNKPHKVEGKFDLLIDRICWQDGNFLAKTGQITSVAAIPSRRFVQVFSMNSIFIH
jgi:hypothetical protein